MQALEELDYLAALDNEGNLSEMGIIMSEFPLEPQMSKTLLASCEYDCVSEVVVIAAMLTGNSSQSDIRTNICWYSKSSNELHVSAFLVGFFFFFSTVLFHGSSCGPETRSHPVPHEVPAPRGRPLHPHQYLQGFQTVPAGPTLVKEASPTKEPYAYFYS